MGMKDRKELGLLDQFEIACLRPGKYSELLPLKKGRKLLYFLILLALLTCIEVVIPMLAWNFSVGGIKNYILKDIPAFTISDQKFSMDEKVDLEFGGAIHLVIDDSKEKYTLNDLEGEYPAEIMISQSNALIDSMDMVQEIRFSEFGNAEITNKSLLVLVPFIRISMGLYVLMMAVTRGGMYLFWALGYALICKGMVRTPVGRTVSFADAFTFSFYAKTLFAIVDSINICIGGKIDETILIIVSVFVTMAYIRKAEFSMLGGSR